MKYTCHVYVSTSSCMNSFNAVSLIDLGVALAEIKLLLGSPKAIIIVCNCYLKILIN